MEQEQLNKMCYNEKGDLRTKAECRAVMINHLIIEELMDMWEAEDLVEKTIRDLNLWPEPVTEKPKEEELPSPPSSQDVA